MDCPVSDIIANYANLWGVPKYHNKMCPINCSIFMNAHFLLLTTYMDHMGSILVWLVAN